MEKIIIVESPSKSKTIGSYLGEGYTVLSSKGHICDLATSGKGGLGIDIENGFIPTYRVMKEKESLVKSLQKQCKGKEVFLATDPDREGEAIAFHLARSLGLNFDLENRIEFHEITKTAVQEALNNPHHINLKMVDSQECRRMIDRILGFKLSKLLQKKIGSKSAGRVQSVVLMMVVDLEKEILAFIPVKYYEMEANFNFFKLRLVRIGDQAVDQKHKILERQTLESLQSRLLSFTVSNITTKQVKRNSYPTFTTSTLQQDASNKIGFNATKTMRVAQSLYEGKSIGNETMGLITYMRTDSTRLSDGFVKDTNEFILNNFGNKYLGGVKIRGQKNMQDAHEGIRPTSIHRNPESVKRYLSDDEYKLYDLIYKRTLASLMSNALFNATRIEFANTDSLWVVTGQQMVFDGYLKVYGKSEDDENQMLPNFELGKSYNADEISILDKETQPHSRYTEASLIKDMEEKGIGRPSTYAQTIQTLKDREYITMEKKAILPTDQGILTTDRLHDFFDDLINVKYTANMESNLDKIAGGEKQKLDELTEFYDIFIPLLDTANEEMEAIYPRETDEFCEECGKPLVVRLGKYGEFISCSDYPNCTYTKKDEDKPQAVDTGIVCPVCNNAHIVERIASRGRNKGNIFYACSDYPKCKVVFNDQPTNVTCSKCGSMMLKTKDNELYCSDRCEEEKDLTPNVTCPKCGKGHFIKRVAGKGKNKGNIFYGCSAYPKCKNIISPEDFEELLVK